MVKDLNYVAKKLEKFSSSDVKYAYTVLNSGIEDTKLSITLFELISELSDYDMVFEVVETFKNGVLQGYSLNIGNDGDYLLEGCSCSDLKTLFTTCRAFLNGRLLPLLSNIKYDLNTIEYIDNDFMDADLEESGVMYSNDIKGLLTNMNTIATYRCLLDDIDYCLGVLY